MGNLDRVIRMSRLFVPKRLPETILKEDGKIEPTIKDPQRRARTQVLMMSEGLIHAVRGHRGLYTLLPLAMRSMDKLIKIVDDHMQDIGGQRLQMPSLVSGHLWRKSGRWESAGSELFRLKDRDGHEYCLGPTHEELITSLIAESSIVGARRFPFLLYQITDKFRDEANPRFGLLRGREFVMKDMYSFDIDETNARKTYEIVCDAYEKIFQRLHLDVIKVSASTGTIGGSYSHEYHLMSPAGEDRVLSCKDCGQSHSIEFIKEMSKSDENHFSACPSCSSSNVSEHNCMEIGHTFLLGKRYSEPLKAFYKDLDKSFKPLEMGCYGLGISRILAASVESYLEEIGQDSEVAHLPQQEKNAQQKGEAIRWPEPLVPFRVAILSPKDGSKEDTPMARDFVEHLGATLNRLTNGDAVLDDRGDLSIGRRLRDSLAVGIPHVIVIGKSFASEPYPLFELISRVEKDSPTSSLLTHEQVIDFFYRKMSFSI